MHSENEYERRWLVLGIDPEIQRYPHVTIRQAYFGTPKGLRIRIADRQGKQTAELTNKTGHGMSRLEHTQEAELDVAEFLYDSSPYRIEKKRYMRDGWEVDFFTGPLTGLVLAEFEMKSPDQEISLPSWIHSAVDVTNDITNSHLARMAYDLRCSAAENDIILQTDEEPGLRDRVLESCPRIVLTGGPCSGKSTAIERLKSEFPGVLHCVPETATIVIDRVGASPPVGDESGIRRFQRVIYRVQCGFEEVSMIHACRKQMHAMLLDRGTVDGAAYLEGGNREFEDVCLTDTSSEYARYAGVIVLDVPPRDVYESQKENNPARGETYEQATELGEKILEVWSGHPDMVHVRNQGSFEEKYATIRDTVESILNNA